MTIWVGLSTLAFGLGLVVTILLHSRVRMAIRVDPAEKPAPPLPFISVVVPARNEARNIRRCGQALLAQDYPAYEVIVVDDRSTDATPHILADLQQQAGGDRLKIVSGSELPSGWAGKPHALCQGAHSASGDWLCFIDADTFAAPQLLSAALATAQKYRADLFTLLTDQELGSFWEKTILPLVFTALSFGFPADRVNDPSKPDAIANGQFILIRQDTYEAVGGHGAVAGRIDEDKAIAEVVKRSGYRLVIADGRAVAVTRMYTNLAEMWEGWTKNIFLGLKDRLGLLLFGASLGTLAALWLPAWLLVGTLGWLASGSPESAIVAVQALVLWVVLIAIRMQAARAFRISPWYAFTLPLGALVFTAMMFASAYKVLSGKGVTWRGRTYQ